MRLYAYALEPAIDFLAAAVYHDGLEADKFQKNNIAHDATHDTIIDHGGAAIFHHDNLVMKATDVRKRLYENIRLVQVFLLDRHEPPLLRANVSREANTHQCLRIELCHIFR